MNGKKQNNNFALSFVILLLVFFLLLGFWIFYLPNTFEHSPKIISVSKGEPFNVLAESLETRGIIRNAFTFKIAGKLLGVTQKIRIGKYSFVSGISNLDILRDMESGASTINSNVTIQEGLRAKQIAKILKREIGIDTVKFMKLFRDTSLIGIYPHRSKTLEGYLMPETYEFYWQDDEENIIKRMITEFRDFWNDSLQRRMLSLGMNLNEVLTMASIVEGEAVYDNERPIIAGVYYNRLKIKMGLQADPTVQYVVADAPRRLTKNDLKIKSPYNTYLNRGLPPGPINNPSKKSIFAALYPAKHNYLYFVSDANGRHRFAQNYEEHQRNVRLYRKARAEKD